MTRPPGIQAIFDELDRAAPFPSIAEVERLLQRRMREYNSSPQAELGGLSPEYMNRLLTGDWTTTGPLRVESNLRIEDVSDAPLLADARTLLAFVAQEGAVKETARQNLPRAAVAALWPRLRTAVDRTHDFAGLERFVPRNEDDLYWLPVLRHTLTIAKLLTRRRGLRISRRGRELLDTSRAGELYTILFRTFFREFNLCYLSSHDRHPGLQGTIAYSFVQLATHAREWTDEKTLAQRAWLEHAMDPPTESDLEYGDLRHYAFLQRVLRPLVQFGLMEERPIPREQRADRMLEFRTTPLFHQFLRLERV